MKVIVIGATGATGRELIKKLLQNSVIKHILVFTRKKLDVSSPKLDVRLINFAEIDKYRNIIKGDILFSALGTTLKDAKSKTKQFEVDYTYQYNLAKISSENNVKTLSLVSSSGANENSLFFYPKIKGILEEMVKKLNFKSIYILRPPVLDRGKDKMRATEKKSIAIINKLNKFGILLSQKPMTTNFLASKMIFLANKESSNLLTTLEAKELFQLC